MKQPHPYQIEGSDFLANGGVLLADEAGLGKTIQAILAAQKLGARRVLILCPVVALGVWRDEITDCWPECTPVMLREIVGAELDWTAVLEDAHRPFCLITGYEYLLVGNDKAKRIVATLGTTGGFDALVLDEAHKLKNPQAKTTMMVYGAHCAGGDDSLVGMAKHTKLLTATPQLNHPGEWYPHMRALDPERLSMRSYDLFTQRYCTWKTRTYRTKTRPGVSSRTMQQEVIDGANREEIPDLARRLRGFWLRRKISDVRGELPPVQVVTRSIEPELCDAAILKDVEDNPEAELIRKAIESGNPEALSRIEGQVSRIRRLLAMAKVNATVAWVEDLLDQGVAKVAVWGWHVEALERIAGSLAGYGSVLITGSTSSTLRGNAQLSFQHNLACQIFVGQIQAAGQSIDLDAASRVVFHEQAWTPALNYQALMRHRRAAKEVVKPLLVEVLAVRGSIDHAVAEILSRKAADIAMLEGAS